MGQARHAAAAACLRDGRRCLGALGATGIWNVNRNPSTITDPLVPSTVQRGHDPLLNALPASTTS